MREFTHRTLADFYAKNFGTTITDILGEGCNGAAFSTSDGKVVKITHAGIEAQIAKSLIGKNLKHITNYYQVNQITNPNHKPNASADDMFPVDKYGILMERINTDCDVKLMFHKVERIRDIYLKKPNPMFVQRKFSYIDLDQLKSEHGFVPDSKLTAFILEFNELLKEVESHGIKNWDYREDNMGRKMDGSLCVFDMMDNCFVPKDICQIPIKEQIRISLREGLNKIKTLFSHE